MKMNVRPEHPILRYIYLGDRLTDPFLHHMPCDPVRNERGKCIVARRMATALVVNAEGRKFVVLRRRLRLASKLRGAQVNEGADKIQRGADIRGEYRFRLWRQWGKGPRLAVIMLNPSTADGEADDPTIRRLYGFAERAECESITVVNLFALRSPNPKALASHQAPVGMGNDIQIRLVIDDADLILCAWGANAPAERVEAVKAMLRRRQFQNVEVKCLGLTKGGYPRHPLYVRSDAPLIDFPLEEL